MNLRVDWGLPKPAGQRILQQHDVDMLEKSLDTLCNTRARHEPSTGAAGTQAGDARMQPEPSSSATNKKRKRQEAEGESEAAAGRSQASL